MHVTLILHIAEENIVLERGDFLVSRGPAAVFLKIEYIAVKRSVGLAQNPHLRRRIRFNGCNSRAGNRGLDNLCC